eukprot:6143864-Pyramimonas_sp.AAC.1
MQAKRDDDGSVPASSLSCKTHTSIYYDGAPGRKHGAGGPRPPWAPREPWRAEGADKLSCA